MAVNIILDSMTTLYQGEPIIGAYTITNNTDHNLIYNVGPQTNSGLTVTDITNRGEQPTEQLPTVQVNYNNGLITTFPHTVNTTYFTIDGWQTAGVQTLNLAVRLIYGDKAEDVSPSGIKLDGNNSVLTQAFTAQVTVLPLNLHHLRDAARALRRSILEEKNYSYREILIDALFSMPGSQVHGSWEDLVADPRLRELDYTLISRLLGGKPSPESASILAFLIWGKTPSVDMNEGTPRYELAEMYNNASPSLHRYIQALYAQNGVQVSEKINLPQVYD